MQFRIPGAIKFVYVKGKLFSWVEMFHIQLYQNSSSMTLDFWLHHLCIYWILGSVQQKCCFQFLVSNAGEGKYKQRKTSYKCFRFFEQILVLELGDWYGKLSISSSRISMLPATTSLSETKCENIKQKKQLCFRVPFLCH